MPGRTAPIQHLITTNLAPLCRKLDLVCGHSITEKVHPRPIITYFSLLSELVAFFNLMIQYVTFLNAVTRNMLQNLSQRAEVLSSHRSVMPAVKRYWLLKAFE